MRAPLFPYFFKFDTFTALAAALSHSQAPFAGKQTVLGKGQPGTGPGTGSRRYGHRLAPLGRAPHFSPKQRQLKGDVTLCHETNTLTCSTPPPRPPLPAFAAFKCAPPSGPARPGRRHLARARPFRPAGRGRWSPWRQPCLPCPSRRGAAACARLRALTGCSSLVV